MQEEGTLIEESGATLPVESVVDSTNDKPQRGRPRKVLQPIDESVTLQSQSLDTEAEKMLSKDDFITLKVIARAIGKDGLSLEEACVIANVDFEVFKKKAEEFPIVLRIIRMKEAEYKHMLMRALAVKARSGDDKMAQWLLERKYPEEFGSKGKGSGDDSTDLLAMAVSFIQESGDQTPIVRKQLELRSVKRVSKPSKEVETLKSFLN